MKMIEMLVQRIEQTKLSLPIFKRYQLRRQVKTCHQFNCLSMIAVKHIPARFDFFFDCWFILFLKLKLNCFCFQNNTVKMQSSHWIHYYYITVTSSILRFHVFELYITLYIYVTRISISLDVRLRSFFRLLSVTVLATSGRCWMHVMIKTTVIPFVYRRKIRNREIKRYYDRNQFLNVWVVYFDSKFIEREFLDKGDTFHTTTMDSLQFSVSWSYFYDQLIIWLLTKTQNVFNSHR